MTDAASRSAADDQLRAVYEQFDVANGRVARIVDPVNEYAWIQSNVVMPVRA